MRIEELVLEGFKSYPVRTQITGWDSSFNAITGLNGSGKSNILDAICFVLGITNMSQMRAANQQDLIYKRGQAGITKASVTIVFDNSDRSNSPIGLEDHKQITVTRQIALPNVSKYLLNGHKALQANIQTLFQSVQLNINNPNFVIMQGRITKVLNMRPQEILGMVEEAAGTRMFEERKDKAKKTMTKKDKRVQEILSLLEEEITPKLEKLRAEKRSFLAYRKSCSELERIARTLRAWEWMDGQQKVLKKEHEIVAKKREVEDIKERKNRAIREGEAAEKDVEDVTKKRDEEMSKGGKMKKLEEEVGNLGKESVKVKTQADLKRSTIKDEEENLGVLEEELQQLITSLSDKTKQVEGFSETYGKTKDQYTANQTTLSTAEELLQTLLTGLSSKGANNTGGGYMGQLSEAREKISQGEAEEKQAKVKLGMSEKELKSLEVKWKEVEREAKDGQRKLEAMRATVQDCRNKMAKCGWNEEMEKAGESKLKIARDEVRTMSDQHERVKQGLGRLNFEYANPTPNFDRSKVRGFAASLISLDEQHYNKATALEIAAGGKLFNVVVENEKIGKDILAHGQLRKRVTIIPLNKITAFQLAARKLQAAERLAPGKVHQALSLVGYADDVANAIAYVFGDALICDDAESAKKVTFSRDVGVRSVTLDGDVYDPSGTLSGGSAPTGSGILIKVQELMEIGGKLTAAKARLDQLEKEGLKGRQNRDEWKNLMRDLEMKEHEMKLMEQQLEGSNAARVGTQVEELKQTIAELKLAVQTAKDKQKAAQEECKKLEKDMDEFKNNKEGKIEQLKADILKQKAALQKHAVIVKTQQKELQTATLEHEQIKEDIEGANKTLDEAKADVAKLRKELAKLNEQVAISEAAYAKAEKKLQEELATLTRFDTELKALANVIKEKKHAVSQADLDLKQLDHAIQALSKERAGAANFVASLEAQYEFIAEDKDQFGKPDTMYHFEEIDIGRMKEKAKELEESQKSMKKKINPKVLNMIENVEKREVDLQKMLSTVMKDKEKIEETIEELDRYKRDALQKTWEKVNGDFGGIFAELLPGNFAKLQPPDGQDLMDGLEVKVQLGSVWKQSLTELSGGQRSLIALSLIMALLQFKPAPMYILDEIDAALDLSHTQHIGQLFRTRFKGSQFIVVSLKEGLFTNANVLFRARFRDGTSIVERTAQRSGSSLYANGGDRDNENGEDRSTRRRRAGGG